MLLFWYFWSDKCSLGEQNWLFAKKKQKAEKTTYYSIFNYFKLFVCFWDFQITTVHLLFECFLVRRKKQNKTKLCPFGRTGDYQASSLDIVDIGRQSYVVQNNKNKSLLKNKRNAGITKFGRKWREDQN